MPIIILTAKGEEVDKVLGLELGADDYIVKPFSPRELIATIKVILRRSSSEQTTEEILKFAEIIVDTKKHKVYYKEKEISLSAAEFKILYNLMKIILLFCKTAEEKGLSLNFSPVSIPEYYGDRFLLQQLLVW